jgi:2-amino-4-hydroxy-6-hydroxymethyldihydropteridine diphosphokinase
MVICYLGIGSNLGNRRKNISLALQKINRLKGIEILKISKIIQTFPVGGPRGQRKFLNAALKIKTKFNPATLLKKLQIIEQELGRPKRHPLCGPRTIDLDILFYGDRIIRRKNLEVPHPRIFAREFVIRPLLEVI